MWGRSCSAPELPTFAQMVLRTCVSRRSAGSNPEVGLRLYSMRSLASQRLPLIQTPNPQLIDARDSYVVPEFGTRVVKRRRRLRPSVCSPIGRGVRLRPGLVRVRLPPYRPCYKREALARHCAAHCQSVSVPASSQSVLRLRCAQELETRALRFSQ